MHLKNTYNATGSQSTSASLPSLRLEEFRPYVTGSKFGTIKSEHQMRRQQVKDPGWRLLFRGNVCGVIYEGRGGHGYIVHVNLDLGLDDISKVFFTAFDSERFTVLLFLRDNLI